MKLGARSKLENIFKILRTSLTDLRIIRALENSGLKLFLDIITFLCGNTSFFILSQKTILMSLVFYMEKWISKKI